MASLTNVIMWMDNQWIPVTARKAIEIIPDGASVHSGFFKCKICKQSLGLSAGKILKYGNRGEPYFYHSLGEDDKSCPERTGSTPIYLTPFSPDEYSLPLRIIITNNNFSFEIGFPFLPKDIFSKISQSKIKIIPIGREENYYEYLFADRFIEENITWLDVGGIPSTGYRIIADKHTQFFWRPVVNGINEKATIFDANSGKMLVQDSDVQVGRDYYLLIKGYMSFAPNSVRCSRVLRKIIDLDVWNVYLVNALDFSNSSADYFYRFGYRLTKMPLNFQSIWPVYIEDPYIIHHESDKVWFYVRGTDLDIQCHPKSQHQLFSCDNGQSVLLNTLGRQQVVSTGRSNLLKFMYLWRDSLNITSNVPVVDVTTFNKETVSPGVCGILPRNSTLHVKSLQFNGFLSRLQDGIVIEKRKLKAGEIVEITDIRYGTELFIYIGLDCIWSIKYEKQEDFCEEADVEFAKRLMNERGRLRTISHSLGAIATELKEYPAVKQWLYQKIREGFMPETAYQMLVGWMINRKKFEV